MNLIINSSPKQDFSVGLLLAKRLCEKLPGAAKTINLYDHEQKYFNFSFNQEWIDAIKASERIIIPVAMWNLSVPAALKDFFDKIIKRGELWDLDINKKYIGLLPDRPVYIIMTSGLEYGPSSSNDFVIPYLKALLSTIGIRNIQAFRVENVGNSAKLTQDEEYLQKQTSAMFKMSNL